MKSDTAIHMKEYIKPAITAVALASTLAFYTACDVEQTEEGEMPDVDVSAEDGNLPSYDVETADVDVGTTQRTVSVPKVRVEVEEEEIEVPYVDLQWPDEEAAGGEVARRTITTRVEAPSSGYTLRITDIYHAENEIHVISTIESTGETVPSEDGVPIQDTIVFNAPDKPINHYVVTDLEDVEEAGTDIEFVRYRDEINIDWDLAERLYSAKDRE